MIAGFCVLGENCFYYDQAHELPGLTRRSALCEGCATRIERDIELLRYDYVDLSQLMARPDGHSDVKISRPKPKSVPPIDLIVFTLREDIAWTLDIWDDRLRDAENTPPLSGQVREGWRVDAMLRFLLPRLDILAGHPPLRALHDGVEAPATEESGVQAIGRLLKLHERARAYCGLVTKTIHVPGFCPQCHQASMRREQDADRTFCHLCKATYSNAEYANTLLMAHVVTQKSERT